MDFSWATPFPEVHKVCKLFQMAEISQPLKYTYRPLQEYLQDGPQCGLVALAMIIGNPTKESIRVLFESARNLNFTKNGEIFSVHEMASLAKIHCSGNMQIEVYSGSLNSDQIKDFILDGGQMLVPYDTEKDNSPSLYRGHKAHWAAVTGGILTEDEFFVVARHGKAKNIAIWKLDRLSESNEQLLEFSPDRKLHHVEYKLPEEGIAGPLGLNGKSVLLKSCKNL
ncbi:hypothetical protein JTB14_004034 [Gonioctena quinquepunctata]|nr:hypothetical protein JTB14_004034 [Gonioctena quinquepunctata]